MENDKGSQRRTSSRKKPFFDSTNLIPAASTSLRKPLFEKPHFLTPIRDTPAESSLNLSSEISNASTSKLDSNSSAPNASVRAYNFRTPSRTRLSNLTGKGNGATNEKLIVYSTRTVAKTKNKAVGARLGSSHGATDLFGFSPLSRTWDLETDINGKGKATAAPDNFPTMQKMKDKENVNVLNLEKSNGLRRDKENLTALNLEKSKGLRRDKENLTAVNLEKSKGLKRATVLPHSSANLTEEDVILLENVNTKRKAISTAYSSSANKLRSNKFRDNFNKSEGTSHMKSHSECKKKRHLSSQCDFERDYIEKQRSYFKEIDEFELPVEEVSDTGSE